MTRGNRIRYVYKPFVALLALLPLSLLIWNFLHHNLSVNPLDDITDETGTWTLRFLILTLAMTPFRHLTGWTTVVLFRRMFGLFAFFYGTLHLFTYLYLDKFFEWADIVEDIGKRPFITAGMTAFLLMFPLAATSFDRMIRWMGGKRWKMLHRLAYGAGIAGVIHYLWLVKADTSRPLTYGAILLFLFGVRIYVFLKPRLVRRSPYPSKEIPTS